MVENIADEVFVEFCGDPEKVLHKLFIPAILLLPNTSISIAPTHKIQLDQAVNNYNKPDYPQARKILESILDNIGEQEIFTKIVLWNIASCCVQEKDYQRAFDILSAFSVDSLPAFPLWNLGLSSFKLGDYKASLASINQYVTKYPEDNAFRKARIALIQSGILLLTGNSEQARESFNSAVQCNTKYVYSLFNRSYLSAEAEKKIEVVNPERLFELLIPRLPTKSDFTNFLSAAELELYQNAEVAIQSSNYDKALLILQDLHTTYPNHRPLMLAVGYVYYYLNRFDDAVEIFKAAQKANLISKTGGIYWWNIACGLARTSDYINTLATLKECLKTEYQSKPQLLPAIRLLDPGFKKEPNDEPARSITPPPIIENGPVTLTERMRNLLLGVIEPRQPGKNPLIQKNLSEEEWKQYLSALEFLSIKSYDNALKITNELFVKHPDLWALEAAVAAIELFIDENEQACKRLSRLKNEGFPIPGTALWNLACACIRLWDGDGARKALLACFNTEFRSKPQLKQALDILNSDGASLESVASEDELSQEEEMAPGSLQTQIEELSSQSITISPELRNQLSQIMQPKRPDRNPALTSYLNLEDIEKYSRALEAFAENDYELTLRGLIEIRENNVYVWPLETAIGAVMLFANKYEEAKAVLLQVQSKGIQMPGSALWNLACAEARIGSYAGTLRALSECAKTEYRTKPQLWTALNALGKRSDEAPDSTSTNLISAPSIGAQPLHRNLPESIHEARMEILNRILRPKKLPKMLRPDLVRLAQRDRQIVSNALDSIYKGPPNDAVANLLPLVEEYPDVYTLKAHLSANLLSQGEWARAKVVLQQAEDLQTLDAISRHNFACIEWHFGNLDGVIRALEAGTHISLAEEYTLWLSLAVAYELNGQSQLASEVAARALSLVIYSPSEKIVKDVLAATSIRPIENQSLDNTSMQKAQKVLAALERNDVAAALQVLGGEIGLALERIPEISSQVYEPQFLQRPNPQWDITTVQNYTQAVQLYMDQRYNEAAALFSRIYQNTPQMSVAVNLTAAYLKGNQPRQAKDVGKGALARHGMWGFRWRLIYNLALSQAQLAGNYRAVQTIQRNVRRQNQPRTRHQTQKSLVGLLVVLCGSEKASPELRSQLPDFLDQLRQSVLEASNDLLLSIVWAELIQATPDIDKSMFVLRKLIQRSTRVIKPAVEVRSMQQIRAANDSLMTIGETRQILLYMDEIVELRNRERQASGLEKRDLEHNVGMEFIAHLCKVRAYKNLGEPEKAMLELRDAEELLRDHSTKLAPGFLVKDWSEISSCAEELGFYYSAFRFCQSGLQLDGENTELGKSRERLLGILNGTDTENQVNLIDGLLQKLHPDDSEKLTQNDAINEIEDLLEHIKRFAPLFANSVKEWMANLYVNDEDIEEWVERLGAAARFELPDPANKSVESWLAWLIHSRGEESGQIDIDVYDEKVWPREDDREACCLLTLTSQKDIPNLIVSDQYERKIWEGHLNPGRTEYIRWIIYREDGFSIDDNLDIPVYINSTNRHDPTAATPLFVNVQVGSDEPVWPSYPTGALSPDDVPGEELYGRLQIIRQVKRSLGPKRIQATFFFQAPRQMGKTSLLYFIKSQAPNHALPVYVNLEKDWSKRNPNNIWNYLVQRVLEESREFVDLGGNNDYSERDFLQIVSSVCSRLNKQYVFLLLDELHFLFEKSENPSGTLASFRDFLNNSENKVALLLSDRYTRDELEKRCPSEYWAQLSLLNVGPLDLDSTSQAIEYPTHGTDVSFLSETIRRLYDVTGGYPYHVQRIAQYTLDNLYSGPWLTVLPEDVEVIIPKIIEQDTLFNSGLCRPDRIDAELAEAIAALLEWRDLCEFLPELRKEPENKMPSDWQPGIRTFLAHMPNVDHILRRLVDIGVLRKDEYTQTETFFSPLVEEWLKKMRRQRRSLSAQMDVNPWQLISTIDGAALPARDWQFQDVELVRRASYRGKPPLREKATLFEDWERMLKEVRSKDDFCTFIDSVFRLIIDGREEKESLCHYPWLFLIYHRSRLIRNYIVHPSPTKAALSAWNTICTRALGGDRNAYLPSNPDEWRAIQIALLRNLYAAYKNAIDLAGQTPQLKIGG